MAKNRVKLEISGVSCALLTEEREEYVQAMAKEVEAVLNSMVSSGSNFPVASVITALSFLDEKKTQERINREQEERLQALEDKLRFAAGEFEKLLRERELLEKQNKNLKIELENLQSEASEKPRAITAVGELRNPFRPQIDETGLVSFYEKK